MNEFSENDIPVKVVVRQKPIDARDQLETITKFEPKSKNVIIVDERPYAFDCVLGPEVSQKQIFEITIQPLVKKVLNGFNCTALAYGQTGTGKSYTMGMICEEVEENHSGIVRRCLNQIMDADKDLFETKISFVEIYNEKVFDLLAVNPTEPIMTKGSKYPGGTRVKVLNMIDCNEVLKRGISKRHVRPTAMNSESSRSHVIFTISVTSKHRTKPFRAVFNLVDLAGSEGLRRTGHTGQAMSEGVHINQGLLCIGKILQAMSEGKKVIPFRDSVLGGVLQEALNPNSYLTLLACISPKRIDLSETLSTLRFAQRAKQLKLTPHLNSLMTELMKIKSKTPFKTSQQFPKPVLTPFKRSASENHISRTFCTPAKQMHFAQNSLNHTDIGLTPKEKTKVQNHLQTERKNPYHLPPPIACSSIVNSTVQRESLFDESWALNASTSTVTTFEAPSCIDKPASFSPFVEKCMEKFGSVIENKMQKFMESFMHVNLKVETPAESHASDDIEKSKMRSEMKSLLCEIFSESKPSRSTIVNDFETCNPPPIASAKCQLFTTRSPVFKIPEIPVAPKSCLSTLEMSKNQSVEHSFDYSMTDNTVRHARRSMRLLNRTLENVQPDSSVLNNNKTIRRSLRLQQSCVFEETTTQFPEGPLRRNRNTQPISNQKTSTDLDTNTRTTKKNKINKKETNSIYDTLFANCSKKVNIKPSKLNNSNNIAKYRKAILELLNKGSMQELQVLPQVGLKTAYQIVTHRTLNGKFKNFAQVEKLPIWRGKGWERFAQANLLI